MPTPATPSPLISVAMSVYNGARFLPAQLDSILAQRGVRLELVVVDDSSGDASLALLEHYARRDERVRVHPNPANLGPTRSFERAMSLCRGEFIAPSDQDDLWDPDKLAILLAAIGQADLAYCDSAYIDGDGRASGRRISDDKRMLAGHEPLRFVFANSVSGHAMLLRRSLFESVRPLPPELFYDWVLAMLAAARGGVAYVDRPLVRFRRHGEAFSSLGREKVARGPDRHQGWVGERLALLRTLAASPFDRDGRAQRVCEALEQAIDRHGCAPLLQSIWRERTALAAPGLAPSWAALRLQVRMLSKLARARREAAAR